MPGERFKLLVVEDNPADAALLRHLLAETPGFAVERVERLSEALARLEAAPPDLVLLDLNLPDATGLAGLERIQRRFADVAVVVLTGFAPDDLAIATEAVSLGAQDYLTKGSLEPPALERVLRLAIERKQVERRRLHASLHDPLTGLPRIGLLADRFERAVARVARHGSGLVVLVAGIDGIDRLRAEEGRDRADARVRSAAERIGRALRRTDALCRLEAGGFLVLCDGLRHASDGYVVARKLIQRCRRPPAGEDDGVAIDLSVGLARFPQHGRDLDALAQAAEAAMLEAMRHGGASYTTAHELAA